MITAACGARARMVGRASIPLSPGMLMSRSTTSGGAAPISRTAAAPLETSRAEYPRRARRSLSIVRVSGSSSTMRIRPGSAAGATGGSRVSARPAAGGSAGRRGAGSVCPSAATRSARATGFSRTPAAPSASACRRTSSSRRPLTMTTLAAGWKARIRLRVSRPPSRGIMRSRTTAAGLSRFTRSSASSPFAAVSTSNPCVARYSASISRISASSSTTSAFGDISPPSPRPLGCRLGVPRVAPGGARLPWQAEREARAAPRYALGPDASAMGLDEVTADQETEPGSRLARRPRRARLRKLLEEQRQLLRGNAGAGVGHGALHLLAQVGDLDVDAATLGRELHCVTDEVHEDLIQAVGVAVDGALQSGRPDLELDLALGDGRTEALGHARRDRDRIDRSRLELELAGLELRDVEDLADQPDHALGRLPDDPHVALGLLPGVGPDGVRQELRIALDHGERSAQVVHQHRRECRSQLLELPDQPLPLDRAAHPRHDTLGRDGLGDIVHRPAAQGALHAREVVGRRRQDDDRDFAGSWILLEPIQGLEAGHHRHVDVEEDAIRPGGPGDLDALGPVPGLEHEIVELLEDVPDKQAVVRQVVDHQDRDRAVGRLHSRVSGSAPPAKRWISSFKPSADRGFTSATSAPSSRARCGVSITECTTTGIARVTGSRLRVFSTSQPSSLPSRTMSSRTSAGLSLRARSMPSAAVAAHSTLTGSPAITSRTISITSRSSSMTSTRAVPGGGASASSVGGAAGATKRVGSRSVKTLPRPGTLSTDSEPPMSRARRRLIERPRPVPLVVPPSGGLTWRNSSKTISWSSGRMPTPVSATATATSPSSSGSKRTVTEPRSVNLTALDRRFRRICLTFPRSWTTSGAASSPVCLRSSPFAAA